VARVWHYVSNNPLISGLILFLIAGAIGGGSLLFGGGLTLEEWARQASAECASMRDEWASIGQADTFDPEVDASRPRLQADAARWAAAGSRT
jgi:hypothetical protein